MFALFQKHVRVLVITTTHLVFEHLIEVFIHIIVFEWRPCLLVALISLLPLFPLSDLRNFTCPKVLISVLGVILLSGTRSVSHGNYLHQFLHRIHHQFELVVQGQWCWWLCIYLGSLIATVESSPTPSYLPRLRSRRSSSRQDLLIFFLSEEGWNHCQKSLRIIAGRPQWVAKRLHGLSCKISWNEFRILAPTPSSYYYIASTTVRGSSSLPIW